MSRAFVNEDANAPREPTYSLPDRDSDYYDEAAAMALLEGANQGNTGSAEKATRYRWGEPRLVEHVKAVLERAEADDNLRAAQLARRFLSEARKISQTLL